MNPLDIIEASEFLDSLKSEYGKLRMITGNIGKWYYPKLKIFFDCPIGDKAECARNILTDRDLGSMIVYFIVEGKDGFQLRDSRFKNIYGQNLERMISHFHMALEPSIRHGLQVGGLKYIRCIGYGAIMESRDIDTIENIEEIVKIVEQETKLQFRIEDDKENPGGKILFPLYSRDNGSIDRIRISDDMISIYAPKNKNIDKPESHSGPEWNNYLKKVTWKDAMSLPIREKYYGILVTFDSETASFKVDLTFPVEEEKLRKACHALIESSSID